MTSPVDIRPDHLEIVQGILREHLPVGVKVWVFGSRASWTTKDSSDLDLALEGKDRLNAQLLGALKDAFEESSLPYTVDVVDLHRIGDSFRQIVESQRSSLSLDGEEGKPMPMVEWRESLYGMFRSDFIEAPLGSLCDDVNGIQTGPFGSQLHQRDYVSVGTPIITVEHLGENRIIHQDMPYVSDEDRDRLAKYTLREGDIVFSRVGSVDRRALVREIEDGWLFSGRCLRVRPDGAKVNPTYLSYFFGLPAFQEHIRSIAVGATMPSLNTGILSAVPIPVPPLAEQRAIAHILGTLDDKIELNRRMNETLEAMARALFKSWFVDFDPVRAKMEGRWRAGESLPGLPAHLYDLFPDLLVDSELGEIPERWEVGTLDETIVLLSGGTPRTSEPEYWGGGIPWYTAKDTPSQSDIFVLETERSITKAGVDSSSTQVLPAGTTVITARGTVGKLACLGVPMAMNQTCYGIRGAQGYSDYFTYWSIRTSLDELQTRTHGTIFDTITRQTFSLIQMARPPLQVAQQFELLVGPTMLRMLNNLQEAHPAAAQRDMLLPKLVSGVTGIPRDLIHAMERP